LSDSQKEGISFKQFFAFDSTTMRLFSEVLKGVGRKLKGLGRQKGGLKVHMLTDIHAESVKFVKMSEVRMHDKKFLQYINCLEAGCMIVFDMTVKNPVPGWHAGSRFCTFRFLSESEN
jgi:hypothetical protein